MIIDRDLVEFLHFILFFFFFNDTATTEIYTLSLHDALPIFILLPHRQDCLWLLRDDYKVARSEEHTSELQSHHDLVCRLLLEKKKKKINSNTKKKKNIMNKINIQNKNIM